MKYFIPFTYGLTTRAKTVFYKISFLVIIVIPMLSAGFFFKTDLSMADYLYVFAIAFTGFYSIYENGYITNDTLTTRFEEEPVLRIDERQLNSVDKLSEVLKAARIVYAMIAAMFIHYAFSIDITKYVICLVALNLIYSLHNYFRGKKTIATIFPLEILKYITVQAAFLKGREYLLYAVAVVLCISIPRSLTYTLKRRLKLDYNEDKVRVIYYIGLTLVSGFVSYLTDNYYFIALSIYMLCFRVACLIFVKKYDVTKIRKD